MLSQGESCVRLNFMCRLVDQLMDKIYKFLCTSSVDKLSQLLTIDRSSLKSKL